MESCNASLHKLYCWSLRLEQIDNFLEPNKTDSLTTAVSLQKRIDFLSKYEMGFLSI